jgi:hypothetical protein
MRNVSENPALRLVRLGKASGLTRAVMEFGDSEPLVTQQYWP